MKTLIKWFIKKYISVDSVKEYIHTANEMLAANASVDGGRQKILGYGDDAATLVAVYLNALADDGRICPSDELPTINAECDRLVDKYLSDKTLENLVDKLIG